MNPINLILGLILVAIIIFALVYAFNMMSGEASASGGDHHDKHHTHGNDPAPPHSHPSNIGGNPATWTPSR